MLSQGITEALSQVDFKRDEWERYLPHYRCPAKTWVYNSGKRYLVRSRYVHFGDETYGRNLVAFEARTNPSPAADACQAYMTTCVLPG